MPEPLFISYSSVDGVDFALQLADELAAGPPPIPVWVDKRALRPGEDWDEQIVESLRTCRGVLFIMTADSVRPNSVCKEEWVRALRYKKPVIPIRVGNGVELPFRLGSRNYIDFGASFDAGLARLRKHVAWMDSPAGALQALEHRLADAQRELPRAPEDQQARIHEEMAELERQIAEQKEVTANPTAAIARVKNSVERAIEREREPARPAAALASSKFINPPPVVAPSWFQDRHVETRLIGEFLRDEALRVMTVVGRGGVGKSAIVCRLLRGLESGRLPDDGGALAVDGIVYLSDARSLHRVTVPELFAGLCRLLPAETAARLDGLYRNPQVRTRETMRALLAEFPQGRTVVLLDNFEDALDIETGAIRDADLDEALRAILELAHHGIKIVITSRVAPVALGLVEPGRQRRVDLDAGLEHPYAETVLREMDTDGKVGLRDASADLLAQARERTRGYPRALEALFGILSADRDTRLPELLADTRRLLPEHVVDVLVGEAFSRLDADAQRVMQALAVYRYPVPPAAVDHLLSPYIVGIDSAPVLARLVNMQFVRREANRYYVHQVDRDYALGRLPSGQEDDGGQASSPLTLLALRRGAAEWFKQTRRPREEWKILDDLAPQLAEYELRCDAGDFDGAAAVLEEFDDDCLISWGHYGLVVTLHQRIHGRLTDKVMIDGNLDRLGTAFWRLGRYERAVQCFEAGVEIAREAHDRRNEAAWLGSLGAVKADAGEVEIATSLTEAALAINRELGNRAGTAVVLGNLANRYSDMGALDESVGLHHQALALVRALEDKHGEAHELANLSLTYQDQGRPEEALATARHAHELAVETGNRLIEIAALCNIGGFLIEMRELAAAEPPLQRALELAEAANLVQFQAAGREKLALLLLRCGQPARARSFAEAALEHDFPRSAYRRFALLGAILLREGKQAPARTAFIAALDHADALLSHAPKLVGPLHYRGIVRCGLALCEGPQHLEAAIDAFRAARAASPVPGVLQESMAALEDMGPADPTGLLTRVRQVVASFNGSPAHQSPGSSHGVDEAATAAGLPEPST
jgi:tetratricopeptide (TPR) repeat protein